MPSTSPTGLQRSHGFTLIELLVALFITAILFTIGYGSLQQALRSREQLDAQSARIAAVQQAMRTIEQDFELLQPRPVRDLLGDCCLAALTSTPQLGTGDSFTATTPGSGGSGQSNPIPIISLTRAGWTNPAGLQRSELQRVTYVFDNGTLMREYWPVLDATQADALIKRPLLDHVRSFALQFIDASGTSRTSWPVVTPGVPATPDNAAGAGGAAGAAALALDPSKRARPIGVIVSLELDDLGLIVRYIEIPG